MAAPTFTADASLYTTTSQYRTGSFRVQVGPLPRPTLAVSRPAYNFARAPTCDALAVHRCRTEAEFSLSTCLTGCNTLSPILEEDCRTQCWKAYGDEDSACKQQMCPPDTVCSDGYGPGGLAQGYCCPPGTTGCGGVCLDIRCVVSL